MHAFPFSDFLGFAKTDANLLTGSEIENFKFPFPNCIGCPQIETHNAYHIPFYIPLTDISLYKCVPPAQWFWSIQAYIQILYNIGIGIPALGYGWKDPNGGDFTQLIASFIITSASGNDITCAIWGINPKNINGIGSLQQFDYVTFTNNVLAERNIKTFIKALKYNSETEFVITLPFFVGTAAIAIDNEHPIYVNIYRFEFFVQFIFKLIIIV